MHPHPVPPPGWYPDPYRVDLQRYWDGGQWTPHTAPGAPPPSLTSYPEVRTRGKRSWGLGDVWLGLGLFFLISVGLGVAVLVAALLVTGGEADLTSSVVSLFLIAAGGVGSAVAFLGVPLYATYVKGQRSLAQDFGLRVAWVDVPVGVGLAVIGLIFGVAVTLASQALFGETPSNTGGLPTAFNGPEILIIAVTFVVVALVIPVVEELFFRGLMLRALGKRFSVAAAVVVSSAVFGLAHLGGVQALSSLVAIPLVTGFYGLVFALASVKTGRIGAAIIAHILINAAAVLSVFAEALFT